MICAEAQKMAFNPSLVLKKRESSSKNGAQPRKKLEFYCEIGISSILLTNILLRPSGIYLLIAPSTYVFHLIAFRLHDGTITVT